MMAATFIRLASLLSLLTPALCLVVAGPLDPRAPSGTKGKRAAGGVSAIGANKIPTDVIIQMFEWNWDSIALECTEFIGPAGPYPKIHDVTES